MKRYLFIMAIFASSCSSNSTSPGSNSEYGPGEFGYTINGKTVLRDTHVQGTAASAMIEANLGPYRLSSLKITLTYPGQLDGIAMNGVGLDLNLVQLRTGDVAVEYVDAWLKDTTGAIAWLQGVNDWNGHPPGTVTITKLDTNENLVSGKFSFIAAYPPMPYDTITNGFFNDVPIIQGGGGFAGAFSGIRNDDGNGVYHDDSFQSPKNGISSITGLVAAGTKTLSIQANVYYSDASYTSLNFTIVGAKAGYFSFNGGGATWSFGDSDGAGGDFSSGGVNITKFDSINHRFSGTFNLGGGGSGGRVTFSSSFQGSMDSVRWFNL